ncbi:MAG: 50S ribosomal protein L3 N(5)-glutamine methyltransferase [Opitutaceae bacterium]|nr:50S ribosomal protein L3 N(5)-glutamine methyltransferase [Opitutaceae bacterium]
MLDARRGHLERVRGSVSADYGREKRTLPPSSQLATLNDWLEFAAELYDSHGLALGQISTTAHDESLYLFLHALSWPLDGAVSLLKKQLGPQQRTALRAVLERRVIDRIPPAYITREAWLNEHRFYVDERVLIPRSYFLEIIPHSLEQWFPDPKRVKAVADVCTGSACLAILLAHQFPRARVDGIDVSKDALDVARINVDSHRLGERVRLHQSDVFDAVGPPKGGYDLIISNPPYEPSRLCDRLPLEFMKEPRLALDGGTDGLTIIRKLIAQSAERLASHGMLLIEVGGLQEAMNREFAELNLRWLESEDEANCICAIQARNLR